MFDFPYGCANKRSVAASWFSLADESRSGWKKPNLFTIYVNSLELGNLHRGWTWPCHPHVQCLNNKLCLGQSCHNSVGSYRVRGPSNFKPQHFNANLLANPKGKKKKNSSPREKLIFRQNPTFASLLLDNFVQATRVKPSVAHQRSKHLVITAPSKTGRGRQCNERRRKKHT